MLEDKTRIEGICDSAGCSVEFIVAEEECRLRHSKNTVILIDEVDAILIDKQAQFTVPTENNPLKIIGLTATKKSDFVKLESEYLNKLGFNIFDSNIKHTSQERPEQMPWQEFFEHH